MAKKMKQITIISFVLFGVFAVIYLQTGKCISGMITFATIAYHFAMRLLVGEIFDRCMHNRADYTKKWYQLKEWENRLYKTIKVKKWKAKMPTYQPDLFSPKKHTWDEVAQAMCQAELVHETIIIFSFLPIAASIFLGSFWVFFITSVMAAGLDTSFVIMQRYNRPRVVKIALKERQKQMVMDHEKRNGNDKK